ncbi:4-hydroxyphenylacetate 3-hydroxylase C-terminal domain-containing protein [Agromyces sp. NPDC049794]|uniref:4-hydroxyphenylacetate 3-hydroxylase C-terminal domain-containing protein n=1 Tax=unclassified Agromyces TaxID=2639701 RepID=UPI0033DBDE7D
MQEFNEGPLGWMQRAAFQASTRLEVKLDFISGLVSKALEITGAGGFRGVQAQLGEILAFRNLVSGLRDGMIERAEVGPGGILIPDGRYALTYAATAPGMYFRMRQIVETIIASGLIYLNSNAIDFQVPGIRSDLDRYLRGSNGKTALDRSKIMKALWDSIGSEFAARHELYELNYWGQPEKTYVDILNVAGVDGQLDDAKALVDDILSDYDLEGFTAPDLINPSDVTTIRGLNLRGRGA